MSSRSEGAHARTTATLRALMRYRDLSVATVAVRLRMTRATVNNYTSGKSRLNIEMVERFAEALHVEPAVLLMEPDDAVRWVLDNYPNRREVLVAPGKGAGADDPELALTDNRSYLDEDKAA